MGATWNDIKPLPTMTKLCTTMMKIDSQSMAVAPKWGQIYSKGAIMHNG